MVTSSELLVRYIAAKLDEACGSSDVVYSIEDVESVEVEMVTELLGSAGVV